MTKDGQQVAIETFKKEGTFLILAGPGTGKTYTVSQRIKSMIESGIDQEKILCLTFSDAAAREMRKKIANTLDKTDISVNIYTFHSFCLNLIQDNPDKFELKENFNIINDAFSRILIKECLDDELLCSKIVAYRDEKNNAYKYISEIKDAISEIKKHRLNGKQILDNIEANPFWQPRLNELKQELLDKISNNKKIRKDLKPQIERLETSISRMKELVLIYEMYSKKMEERNLIDFSDMIDMVLTKFESDEGFLSEIANNYDYILVDEYQDTNYAQNSIVINLAKAQEKKNVFVVGDDDQIIYTFQGADLYTINNFKKQFPETETICLNRNWRSTQDILDISREIIKNPDNPNRIPKDDLISANFNYEEIKNKPRILGFDKKEQEYSKIVDEIFELAQTDCYRNNLKEIAVLVHSHREIEKIATLLKNKGIQVQTSGGKDIFKIRSVITLLLYMQFLSNPRKYENKFFELLLTKPFCIHPKDYEYLKILKTNFNVIFNDEMISKIHNDKDKFVDYEKINKFISNYLYLKSIINKENIKDTVLTIGTKSGIFSEYLTGTSKSIENIEGLSKLIDEADAYTLLDSPCDFVHFVEYLNRNNNDGIVIKTDKPDVTYNAVQILTLHDSKGREFEYVYMPSIERGKWESTNKSNVPLIPVTPIYSNETYEEMQQRYDSDKHSELVRLMYVGMTRAKHTLRLSYANPGKHWSTQPSKYIENFYKENVESNEIENKINRLFKFDYDDTPAFEALIDNYVNNAVFSASSLNEYISCPKKYLFNHILGLKVRDNNQDSLSLGLAVHKAYQDTVTMALDNSGIYPNEFVFQELFQEEMLGKQFSEREIQKNYVVEWAKVRGNAYKHLTQYPAKDFAKPEYKFIQEISGEKFNCIIDRIPYIDGNYYIHDYKTGTRPENVDEVKNKKSEYYNQLALYKFALEKHDNIKIKDCVLIYPFAENLELPLYIDDNACEEVIELYLNTIKNIREHKFESSHQNKQHTCKWCSFKEICNYYSK